MMKKKPKKDILKILHKHPILISFSTFVIDRADPGSGNLITFLQFAFIALEGFLFTSKCGTERMRIGLRDYLILVVMFFVASVCNNYAFDFNIPMPLHMIFRAVSFHHNYQFLYANFPILLIFFVHFVFLLLFVFCFFFFFCTGFADSQHDNGHYHPAETLRFLKIPIGADDYWRHHNLHDYLGQRSGEFNHMDESQIQLPVTIKNKSTTVAKHRTFPNENMPSK